MGTFLKYIFYLTLVLFLYLIAKGIWDGEISEESTMGEVASDVASEAKNMVNQVK